MWNQPYTKTDIEYLAEIDVNDNHRLWRMFFHEERWAESMASFVDVYHIVDIDVPCGANPPTAAYLYQEFCRKVRRDLGVSLPELFFAPGGTIVADSISLGATSASAGSTKSPAKKKGLTWQGKKTQQMWFRRQLDPSHAAPWQARFRRQLDLLPLRLPSDLADQRMYD